MSWQKRTLGELVDNFSFRAKDVGGSDGLEFYGVSNEDGIIKTKYAAEDKAEDYKIIEKDCFAYNPYRINVGSIGLVKGDEKGLISPAYVVFKPKLNSVVPELLLKFLKSNEGLRQIKFYARGTVRQALRYEDLCKIELSLPDYDQQVILYETLKEAQYKSDLLDAEFIRQQGLVQKLRQAFLREAMQGKLVEQDKKDGHAKDLLAQIKAEKTKAGTKEKPLPTIKPEEIPFDIPDNWVWCRLGEIIQDTEGGKSPNCLHKPAGADEWGVIKTTAVQELFFLENENKVLPKGFVVSEQYKVKENDLLITRAGPKNRVGIVCCVENLTQSLILSDKTIRINHLKNLLSSKYIAIAFNSPLVKAIIETKMTGMADSQVNISQDNIKAFPIPLPPLAEQKRIVKKFEELNALCNDLLKSVELSKQQNCMLLQQVLMEALQQKMLEIPPATATSKITKQPKVNILLTDEEKRDLLGGYLISQADLKKGFGHLKFVKHMVMVEYFSETEMPTAYHQHKNGPYDKAFMQQWAYRLKKNEWFEEYKVGKGFGYKPLAKAQEIEGLFEQVFAEKKQTIDFVIRLMNKTTSDQAEIIATVYAVWNDLLLNQMKVNETEIKKYFFKWSDHKKSAFTPKQVVDCYNWMIKQGLIPKGTGKAIMNLY